MGTATKVRGGISSVTTSPESEKKYFAQCVFCALDGGRLELRGFRRVEQANTKDDGASAVEVSFIVLGSTTRSLIKQVLEALPHFP